MVPAVLVVSSLLAVTTAGTGSSPVVLGTVAPEPHPSWEEPAADEVVEPGDPSEATLAPTEEPADAVAEPADESLDPSEATAVPESESESESEPEPEPGPPPTVPESSGLGLIITSGVLGAVGWGAMGWRMSIVKNGCRSDTDLEMITEDDVESLIGSGVGCGAARVRSTIGWVVQAGPNSAAWVTAPVGGMMRGKYDAARFVLEDGPDRNTGVFVGVGASLLAAGAIGRIAVAYIRAQSIFNVDRNYAVRCAVGDDGMGVTPEEFFDCYARKNMLHFFGHQITSASVAAGAGLLTYGLAYKKTRRDLEEGRPIARARMQLSVTPQLSLHHTGLAASLRF